MKKLSLKFEKLPQNIKNELMKKHTHAETAYNNDPDQIVYTEKSVLELLRYVASLNS